MAYEMKDSDTTTLVLFITVCLLSIGLLFTDWVQMRRFADHEQRIQRLEQNLNRR
jgi:hypothetical protein